MGRIAASVRVPNPDRKRQSPLALRRIKAFFAYLQAKYAVNLVILRIAIVPEKK